MKPESSAASWLKFFTAAGIDVQYAEHYAVTFSKNQIQLDMLPEINKDYLNDMGINLLGHVIAILRHAKLVYADEVKKSELPSMKKLDPKATKGIKDPKQVSVKASKTPSKTNEEYEKPSSSVVKRKSTVVQLSTSESSEPKTKVRKNLCDSSDDITLPKAKSAATSRITNDIPSNEEARKGVFKRLGVEVIQLPAEVEASQPNVNGVFSRLGGKTEPAPVVKVSTLPTTKQPISSQEICVAKPLARKSIIRTRLDKPQTRTEKPLRIEPQTYMDKEILKTERRLTSQLCSNKNSLSCNRDIKSRLGFSSSKTVAPQGPVKKVSFGSVSQKLIPKAGTQKLSSHASYAFRASRFPSNRPSGVFSRLGMVPY